jgi:tetratricopeptide (TPR) repeat protein
MRLPRLFLFAAVWVLLFSFSASCQNAKTNLDDPERQQAMQLYHQHKLPEAAALLEKVLVRYPEDSALHEAFGSSLLSRADTWSDPEKRKADRLRARAELLRAHDLGDNSDLCKTLLSEIPEDGSETSFSRNQEADAAMQRGEAAFASGDFDKAIPEYSHAIDLDPKLYLAAVDIGDCYFRMKKGDEAGKWFARAIEINPNAEVAYRYWGDSLLQDGKMQEARARFVSGFLAEPYRQTSWGGLHNWLQANHLSFKRLIQIKLPDPPTTDAKGHVNINVDAADPSDASAAWLAYSLSKSVWRGEKFAKEFPQEKQYRHSLKEEADALSVAASVFEEQHGNKTVKNPDPSLVLLSELKKKQLLEPYVLLILPDDGIARDYAAYKSAHPDKLVQFFNEYILPETPELGATAR